MRRVSRVGSGSSLGGAVRLWCLVVGVMLGAGPALAADPVEGRDYTLVQPPQPVLDPAKIVVTDFFSYACPHCFAFAPALKSWESKLPKDVVVERVSVSFGRQAWMVPAQTYYTLRSLGKAQALDGAVFNALHVEHLNLTTVDGAADWAAAHGVDRKAFVATVDSFSTKAFVQRGDQLARTVRLAGVPTLIVDGKYMVAINDNGDFASQLAIVDAMIAKTRAERGLPQP